jgi:cytochrome b
MKKVKVWDFAVRLSHLLMGLLVLGAFLTSEDDGSLPLHTRLGLVLLGVVLFRVAWGFVGTPHARFADFVKSPREVLAAARAMVQGKRGVHPGHNPVGGVMVVTLLATLAVTTLTGIAMALGPEWSGPLSTVLSKRGAHVLREVHEAAAELLPMLIALHVAGVLVSSLLEKQNLVLGMVTGFKRVPAAHLAALRSRPVVGFLAAVLLGVGAVLAAWRLLPVGEAQAAPPLLSRYAELARTEDPAFTGFDAARGKSLYFEVRDGKTSCATCHTSDPHAPGRSPVGKVIDPLSPLASPERFTDQAKADKWFDRNCKQVLGRLCTARERGDLLTWLTTR